MVKEEVSNDKNFRGKEEDQNNNRMKEEEEVKEEFEK